MLSVKGGKPIKWNNWSQSVHCQPEYFVEPNNLLELMTIVKNCRKQKKTIRVVGSGHSFTPLVATSEVLLSIDKLSGIDCIDHENNYVTVWAGTKLSDLGNQLHEKGYALENLGDINAQTIAGAISTGTHGTGISFGSISTQVIGITILTAAGELLEISHAVNKRFLQAAKLSLGMLGIIVKITLKVLPAYQLIGHSYRYSLHDCLSQLDRLKQENRNFEFYYFPYTNTVQVKTMNLADIDKRKQSKFKKLVIENGLFYALSEISRLVPRSAKFVSTVSALGVPVGFEANDSHQLYATPRLVKFNEMEYSVPAEAMGEVLREIDHVIRKNNYDVHFPIECRYVKADEIWLSPSYERDSAYIAIHMYKGMEFTPYFSAIESVFKQYEGRPHWGKMHTMTYENISEVYPRLSDFLRIREELDEAGLFLNEYVRKLFQIDMKNGAIPPLEG